MNALLFALVDADILDAWMDSRWDCGVPLRMPFDGCPGCNAIGYQLGAWRSLWGVL